MTGGYRARIDGYEGRGKTASAARADLCADVLAGARAADSTWELLGEILTGSDGSVWRVMPNGSGYAYTVQRPDPAIGRPGFLDRGTIIGHWRTIDGAGDAMRRHFYQQNGQPFCDVLRFIAGAVTRDERQRQIDYANWCRGRAGML